MYKNYYIDKNVLFEIIEKSKGELGNRSFYIKDIPVKKLNNVSKIYKVDIAEVIALCDTTVFGSGKDGFIISNNFIGVKEMFNNPDTIGYKELVLAEICGENNFIRYENINIGINGFASFWIKFKKVLIQSDENLKNIYSEYVENSLKEIEESLREENLDNTMNVYEKLMRIFIADENKMIDARLAYFGALIYLERLDFTFVETCYKTLVELGGIEQEKLDQLREKIDEKNLELKVNDLNSKKTKFLEEYDFDNAILISKELGILNNLNEEEISLEISKINEMKKEYIILLEDNIETYIGKEEYQSARKSLEKLNRVNSDANYDIFEVKVNIGLYNFGEAEKKIEEIKINDGKLAINLLSELKDRKKIQLKNIKEKVKEKDYQYFSENEELATVQDEWGMTALMHFIIQEDIEGVRSLKNTFNYEDRSVLGHTTMNLIAAVPSEEFKQKAFTILDAELAGKTKSYNRQKTLGNVGKFLLRGIDEINIRSEGNLNLFEATTQGGEALDKKLDNKRNDLENYLEELQVQNELEFKTLNITQLDFKKMFDEINKNKKELSNQVKTLKQEMNKIENSFDDRFNKELKEQLDNYITKAINIEVGEKDEFETTKEFEMRKEVLFKALKTNYSGNKFINDKIEILRNDVMNENKQKIKELIAKLSSRESEYNDLERRSKKTKYLLECLDEINIEDVFEYVYSGYIKTIMIGEYNADEESFKIEIAGKASCLKVKREFAKEFRDTFTVLKPTYKRIANVKGDKGYVKHLLIYNLKGSEIKLEFLNYII